MIEAVEANSFLLKCLLGSVVSVPRERRIGDGQGKVTTIRIALELVLV